jgi:hypothetical protein
MDSAADSLMGAAFSAAKIATLGVRYDPSSIKQDFHSEAARSFNAQNAYDRSFIAQDVIKAGMPDPSSVEFRAGGLVSWLSGRSFTFGNSISTSDDTMTALRNGSTTTLAHELRHIAQERSIGTVVFMVVWLFQEVTSDQQYKPGNTTLEPYYQRQVTRFHRMHQNCALITARAGDPITLLLSGYDRRRRPMVCAFVRHDV